MLTAAAVAASDAARFGALRAGGALAALLIAGWAQGLLEWEWFPPPPAPLNSAWLFAAASGLAVWSTWGRRAGWVGARPLRLEVPHWGWALAGLPGALCLGAATWINEAPTPQRTIFSCWAAGIVLLLVPGAVQARRRRPRTPDAAPDWTPRALTAAVAVAVAVALVMRLAFDIESLPAFVEADEVLALREAKEVLGSNPFDWLRLYWVGVPLISLVFTRAAELVFGETLWGIRMGGVVLGTLTVVATFAFARRLIGNAPALLAALLVAEAHTLVHWSRNGHPYIQSPLVAAVVLWLFVRTWNGGSLLAWLATGVALGIAAQTYQASQLLPLLLAITALGWTWASRVGWRAGLPCIATILVVALLIMSPVLRRMLEIPDVVASRPAHLVVFGAEVRAELGDRFVPWLFEHARQTLQMFNIGTDFFPNYSAHRALVDGVTAAMVPLAAALLLVRWRTPTGWLCVNGWALYLFVTVFLARYPPTYHRVPTVLLFVAVGVAWTLFELLAILRDGWHLNRRVVIGAAAAFAVAAGVANADFYFREFPAARPMTDILGLALIACPYADTHAVVSATVLDDVQYVPHDNAAVRTLCPHLQPVFIRHTAQLWDIGAVTQAERAVLIVPEVVATAHPGTPAGYRIVNRRIDSRIRHPTPLPLLILELERAPQDPARDLSDQPGLFMGSLLRAPIARHLGG